MKKLYTLTLLAVAALALAPGAASAGSNAAFDAPVGSTVADFKLPDASGKEHSLSSLKGRNGTVIIFVSTNCPVSNAYNERMEKLAQDLKAKGVALVGINANNGETADEIKRHAAQHNLTFPILKDAGNRVADQLGAAVTPEAYFLDTRSKLVYKGRIDNSRTGEQITSTELRDAVEATIAGKPVEKTEVRAFGCSIKRAS